VTVIEVLICKISSKLVHAFDLQTPVTAECSMRGC